MLKALEIVFIVTGLLVLILTSWSFNMPALLVVLLFTVTLVCTYGIVVNRTALQQLPLKLAVSVLIACSIVSVVFMAARLLSLTPT